MDRARELSAQYVASGDPTGWFEQLYVEGQAGTSIVPWVQGMANPILVEWARGRSGAGRKALAAVHEPVAPGGTLLVISFATTEAEPVRDLAMMLWPLTRAEVDLAGGPLRPREIEYFMGENPPLPRWRAEFTHD